MSVMSLNWSINGLYILQNALRLKIVSLLIISLQTFDGMDEVN